jgi:hypothetical protein
MAEPIFAADTAQTTLAGASITLLVAGLGWLGTRKSKPEAASVLVESAVKLAQAAATENDDLRSMVAEMRAEVAGLRAAVAECEAKHQSAQAALIAAGIISQP